MPHLVDTNLLLRRAQPHHPQNAAARAALEALRDSGEELCITPQNLMEFWSVATRPLDANGLGMSPEQAAQELAQLEKFFRLLSETPDVFPQWRQVVLTHQVSGRQVHDAHLVATMLVHGVIRILTFNASDFRRYDSITAVHPSELISDDDQP